MMKIQKKTKTEKDIRIPKYLRLSDGDQLFSTSSKAAVGSPIVAYLYFPA